MPCAAALVEKLRIVGRLPTPPGVVMRLLELTQRNDVSMKEVLSLVSADPVMAAKILRYVNSPMAGLSREVTSLSQAVTLVGTRGVQMLALSFAVVSTKKLQSCARFDATQYALQSIAAGVCAKLVAEGTKDPGRAQEAFVAGLLSQLGRAALAVSMPDEYAEVLQRVRRLPADLHRLERERFGASHTAISAELLRGWTVPEATCDAIARAGDVEQLQTPLSILVATAETLAFFVCPDKNGAHPDAESITSEVERHYGMTHETCIELLAKASLETKELRALLEVPSGSVRSADDLETEIRERIAELTLAVNRENQVMAANQGKLLRMANTDPLTSVGNRAAFDARLACEIDQAMRTGGSLAFLFVDVDRFKSFNDTYGHQAGDKVLCGVARTLENHVRKVDYVARYGGEEFVVIAPGLDPHDAYMLAERLRRAVAAGDYLDGRRETRITISIGVAVLSRVTAPADSGALFHVADEQLYKAKHKGRDRVEVACVQPTQTGSL